MTMHLVDCSYDAHAAAILAILNEAIVNSTALYDYVPRRPESMVSWFRGKEERNFPVIGAQSDDGTCLASPAMARSARGRPTSTPSKTASTSIATIAARDWVACSCAS
jgi:L-amino acid N-acyltransferase YncA